MKVSTVWKEKMIFQASADGHVVEMDTKAPIGTESALSPKQLVVAGLAGCTAMDVVALLRKYKQPLENFEISADIEKSKNGHPEVFTQANLRFQLKGKLDPEKVLEAVKLSQTKYCGVSAMLSKAFPIHYQVELNGDVILEHALAFPAEI